MTKRTIDVVVSLSALIALSPIILTFLFLVWRQDRHSPFYIAPRIGRNGKTFGMVKMRSMVVNADATGVVSTSASDSRITPIGQTIRRFKMDEVTQLWNVLRGDMSLVGPRPQVAQDVALYTDVERHLLSVKPGITDLASIVFSDEGDILKDSQDPNLDYNQLIRPWKSRLALMNIQISSVVMDLRVVCLTALSLVSRERALAGVQSILKQSGADSDLIDIAARRSPLSPSPPPGSSQIASLAQMSATTH